MAGPEAEGLAAQKQAKYLNTLDVLERFSETKQQQLITPTHITQRIVTTSVSHANVQVLASKHGLRVVTMRDSKSFFSSSLVNSVNICLTQKFTRLIKSMLMFKY